MNDSFNFDLNQFLDLKTVSYLFLEFILTYKRFVKRRRHVFLGKA